MYAVDWLVLGYLAYVTGVVWLTPVPAGRRTLATLVAVADAMFVWWLGHAGGAVANVVHDWLPAAQILIGYWLSGVLFLHPMSRLERWLLAWDHAAADRCGGRRVVERLPRAVFEVLELAYLSVSFIVPAGFALVFFLAPDLDADRYWTVVVSAELGCYAFLPWFQTRTPDALGSGVTVTSRPVFFRRVNRALLRRVSIGANTFPSGHAAGAVATALAVGELLPVPGVLLMAWAVAIMVGSVVGRYHYLPDAIAGAGLATLIWVV